MKDENVLFMVFGDMNARTNDKNDFITYDNTTLRLRLRKTFI